MRYSTEPRFRKCVKGYGFLSFARQFGNKYRKKLMDTATKTRMDAEKIACKRVVQKTAEATRDVIGNKIADKIASIGKIKEKEKTKETEKIYIPREKANSKNDLRLFWEQNVSPLYKMEFQKITDFLDVTSDDKYLPKFVTKNGLSMINQKEITMLIKKLELEFQC